MSPRTESLASSLVPDAREGTAAAAIDFFDLSREDLAAALKERLGAPAFRATQLFEWVYKHGVRDLAQMNNISKSLRDELRELLVFPIPRFRDRQISSDGTRKYLFAIDNGDLVESVMIKQPNRMTLCVSSQVGCGMACAFCRTGTMGFRRNLRASEIIQQVVGVIEDAVHFGDMFQNIVFMGMGEPLHNYKNVVTALKVLRDEVGFNFSGRKITVSSAGLVPAIEKFGRSGVDVNLAISLNATTDEVRSEVMPVNKAFPLERLLKCLREYPLKPRRRITMEYVMLAGVNDTDADLERLPRLIRGIPSKVNLIPYNENAGLGFLTPSRMTIQRWQDVLTRQGIDTTIRWSKGQDIKAACGQLAVDALVKKRRTEIQLESPPPSSKPETSGMERSPHATGL